ncbi:MAG TPA: hypothetical protein VK929_17840 [Longimicrobiales bacterium]|nr:hypothetical protein [Longimicrobiales bacterium]
MLPTLPGNCADTAAIAIVRCGWWLVTGGWWLVTGGWWLVAGDW